MGSVRWDWGGGPGHAEQGLCVSGEAVNCVECREGDKHKGLKQHWLEPARRGVPGTINNQELCKPIVKTLVP